MKGQICSIYLPRIPSILITLQIIRPFTYQDFTKKQSSFHLLSFSAELPQTPFEFAMPPFLSALIIICLLIRYNFAGLSSYIYLIILIGSVIICTSSRFNRHSKDSVYTLKIEKVIAVCPERPISSH